MSTSAQQPEASQPVSRKPKRHQLLTTPLLATHIPAELLSNLKLRSLDVDRLPGVVVEDAAALAALAASDAQAGTSSTQTQAGPSACSVCPACPPLPTSSHLRAHARSEWHRYNLALSLRKGKGRAKEAKLLTSDEFEQAVQALDTDLSETDPSDLEASNEAAPVSRTDHVAQLLARLAISSAKANGDGGESSAESDVEETTHETARDPFFWFVTSPAGGEATHMEQTQLGIYRPLLTDASIDGATAATKEPSAMYLAALRSIQTQALEPASLAALVASRGAAHLAQRLSKLKGGKGTEEAAVMLGGTFLDARGLFGRDRARKDDDQDEDDDSSSAEWSGEDDETASMVSSLPATPSVPVPKLRIWTLLLLGGGHFSGVIVALNPCLTAASKRTGKRETRFVVLAHKAFHRYTTRKKQGGGQAAQDATGRFAKSAGAQLRRYGEQALGEEVRELLDTEAWRRGIAESEKVWVRAGARSARGLLWSWGATSGGASQAEPSPLEGPRGDGRLSTMPFNTRRPTVGEALRCFGELVRVKVKHDSDEELRRRDDEYRAQLEGGAREREERRRRDKERRRKEREEKERRKKVSRPVLDEKEVKRRERFERLVEMFNKGRVEAAVNHLAKYEEELLGPDAGGDGKRIDNALPMWWRRQNAREKGVLRSSRNETWNGNPTASQLVPGTLLQLAAEGGHEDMVNYLLVERHADPSIGVPPPPFAAAEGENDDEDSTEASPASTTFPHRTAYDLCSSRGARDAFRRLMASQPEWFGGDWSGMGLGGARVPSALTKEMEERQMGKVKDRRAMMREKAKARQVGNEKGGEEVGEPIAPTMTTEQQQPVRESHATKNRLGGAPPRALQEREMSGLSAEMKMRIEREKRARAAEERFKKLGGGA